MKLKRWSVDNYRSVISSEIDTGEFTALIGKNNSGKSNLSESMLRYFGYLEDRVPIDNCFKQSEVRNRNPDSPIVFDAIFSFDPQEQEELSQKLANDNDFLDSSEDILAYGLLSLVRHRLVLGTGDDLKEEFYFRMDGQWMPIRMRELNSPNRVSKLKFSRRHLIDDPFELYYIEELDVMNSDHRYQVGDTIPDDILKKLRKYAENTERIDAVRRPQESMTIEVQEELFSDAENLSNVLHTLSQNKKRSYDRITDLYIDIMEGVTDVTTPIRPTGSRPETTIEVVEGERSYNLEEISSGSMEVLALLTKLVLAEGTDSMLIIEEPELHLHPAAERQILELIDEVSSDSPQILVTTHSDVFVDSTDAAQIVRVLRNESTTTRDVDEIDQELSDLGYSKSGFLQANGVVFVEGKSDERVLRHLCLKKGFDPDEQGIKFVELDGEGNIKSDGRSLVKLLDSFDIPYIFVADSHGSQPSDIEDELVSHINSRKGDWHTTPDHFYIFSGYGIEDYLVKMPSAIASVVDASEDEIKAIVDKSDSNGYAQQLNQIFKENLGADYNKAEHGMMIAKHAKESEIQPEIEELIRKIEVLPSK